MRTIVSLAAVALCAMGCASSGTQVKSEQLQAFQPGVTTRNDIIKALGPPQQSMSLSDGTSMVMYVYAHSRVKARSFIPYVGAFSSGANVNSNTATFRFDPNGHLMTTSASESQQDVRTGIVSGAK